MFLPSRRPETSHYAKRLKLAELQVGLAFFAFILIGLNDGALGVLIPSLRTYYGVDKATIGLLFLFQTIGYLIAAFNSGLLVERLGNRRFLMLGVASFLLGVVALSLMLPFKVILIMMLPLGFGIAIIDAGLNTYIASMPRNAAPLNYLHAFYGTGALLGPVVASAFLAIRWGWNSVYILWIGMSLILLIGLKLVFKGQNISPQEDVATRPKSNVLVAALREPVVWIAALFLLIYVGAEVSVGSWSYSFLTEERHVSILLAGWMVSGYWIGLTLGRLTLAKVTLWVGSERLIQGCLGGVVIGLLLVWLVPVYAVSAVGLGLIGFSFGPIYPTAIALISNKVAARILPSAIQYRCSRMPLVCGYGGRTHRPLVADALCDYPDSCNGLLLASLAGPSPHFIKHHRSSLPVLLAFLCITIVSRRSVAQEVEGPSFSGSLCAALYV